MTSYTPNLQLPYPDLSDTANVPRDIQALAVKLDTGTGGLKPVLTAAPVLDVGQANQVRAGRALTVADFTTLCGLPTTPVGLFNLSDLTNQGSGGPLVNKGSVPFGVGINGVATTAAQFAGSTGQALYISDTGAADPFRIRTGSWGCWFRTAKRATSQFLIVKSDSANASRGFNADVNTNNVAEAGISITGAGAASPSVVGVSDVCDDRWHHMVSTHDGTTLRLYVDGVLEGAVSLSGPIFASTGPLNIGGFGADGATAAQVPYYGRVDEAFVTPDVLTDDQVRLLYCAKVAHGYASTPTRANLNVRRSRRGGAFVVGDFPAQPLRLHNFTAGALTDQGSNATALTLNQGTGAIVAVAGADGSLSGAYGFSGAHTGASATDAGLPAGTASRSYGCWFKTTANPSQSMIAYGTTSTADVRIQTSSGGLYVSNGGDAITGPFVADGAWHFVVGVEDNAAGDGVKRKGYLDGRLIGGSTVLNAITLAGANRFRVGANADGTVPFTGQLDGAFVYGGALTMEQVAVLYQKGAQALTASPKEPGAHIEAFDAASVYAVFDTLNTQDAVDLGVGS